MSALKPLTESSQNCLNNNMNSHEGSGEDAKLKAPKTVTNNSNTNSSNAVASAKSPSKIVFKDQSLLKTPKLRNPFNHSRVFDNSIHNKTFQNKNSDTTIQLDLTQVGKSPITSTPLVNNFDNEHDVIHESTNVYDESTQSVKEMNSELNANQSPTLMSVGTTSFIEKDEFTDKVAKLIAVSKKRLGENELDVGRSFYEDNSHILGELDIIDKEPNMNNETLIKLLTDSLVKMKNNLNFYKLEAKLVVQNNQDLYSRNEVENKLLKRELEKIKFEYNLDRDSHEDEKTKLQKYESLKKIARESLDGFEVMSLKNRELGKKALKYKVKYNQAKDQLKGKENEIKLLKKSLKSPPRFKIVQQQPFQQQSQQLAQKATTKSPQSQAKLNQSQQSQQPQQPQQQQQTQHQPSQGTGKLQCPDALNSTNSKYHSNDTTISPDHTIITQSPTSTISSSMQDVNRVLPLPITNSQSSSSSPARSAGSSTVAAKTPGNIRAYDTLNMLASQALLASSTSYERTQKARKSNGELSIPTITSRSSGFDEVLNRKLPSLNSFRPAFEGVGNESKRTTTKLPSINHLLSRPAAYNPAAAVGRPKMSIDFRPLNQSSSDSDKDSANLNSNDTIDEDQTY